MAANRGVDCREKEAIQKMTKVMCIKMQDPSSTCMSMHDRTSSAEPKLRYSDAQVNHLILQENITKKLRTKQHADCFNRLKARGVD